MTLYKPIWRVHSDIGTLATGYILPANTGIKYLVRKVAITARLINTDTCTDIQIAMPQDNLLQDPMAKLSVYCVLPTVPLVAGAYVTGGTFDNLHVLTPSNKGVFLMVSGVCAFSSYIIEYAEIPNTYSIYDCDLS